MYILNLKGLIAHLSANKPTQHESFQYILGWAALILIERVLGAIKDTPNDNLNMVAKIFALVFFSAIGFLIVRAYFRALYSKNGGDFGEYFLERALAILFVVSCRVAVVMFPAMALILALVMNMEKGSTFILLLGLILFILGFASIIYTVLASLEAMEKVRNVWKNRTNHVLD